MLGARHHVSGNAMLESCQSQAAIDRYPPTRELSDERCGGCASALSSTCASPAVRQPHRTQRVLVGARGLGARQQRSSIVRASPVVHSARACGDSVPTPRPREGGESVGRGAGPGAPCERLPHRLRSAHRGSVARCRVRRDRTAPLPSRNPPAGLPARRLGQAPAEGVHLRARAEAGVSPGCARGAERRGPRAGGNRALAGRFPERRASEPA